MTREGGNPQRTPLDQATALFNSLRRLGGGAEGQEGTGGRRWVRKAGGTLLLLAAFVVGVVLVVMYGTGSGFFPMRNPR
jgi:hypothetical protein